MPYDICIYRAGRSWGTWTYTGDKVKDLVTTCWFDRAGTVGPGVYTNCSATNRASNQKPGIQVKWGVFIHQGEGPQHSKGCYVITGPVLMQIWNDIPKNAFNVTVTIVNTPYVPAPAQT